MSGRKVLDSYAVIAFFENEPGADKVAELLRKARDAGKPLLLSVVNWGEIFYILCRKAGETAARKVLEAVETLPIEVVDADKELTLVAAGLKAKHKMSYADCFTAALAKTRKAELVTGDKEFREVERNIAVLWL